jgi:hypothetical protein
MIIRRRTTMVTKAIWGIIAAYSIAELIYVWVDWYKYLYKAKKEKSISAKGVLGNYTKLVAKALIPGLLGIFAVLACGLG